MTTPESKTPMTDALDESLIPWASDQETMKQLRIHARSLELKLNEALAEAYSSTGLRYKSMYVAAQDCLNIQSEINKARELCNDCKIEYNPSLIESGHCIFCISKQFKQQRDEALAQLAEAQKVYDALLELQLTGSTNYSESVVVENYKSIVKELAEAKSLCTGGTFNQIAKLQEQLAEATKDIQWLLQYTDRECPRIDKIKAAMKPQQSNQGE